MTEHDDRNEDEITVRQYLLSLELAEGEKTGYRAGKNVQERYGLPSSAPGTLYPALNDLVDRGFVEKSEVSGSARKTNNYSLTQEGLNAAKRFAKRYEYRGNIAKKVLDESEEVE